MAAETEHTRTPCDGAAVVERHDMYYFNFVVFQVQTTLFSVPKNGFLDSNPSFFDKFAPNKSIYVAANDVEPIELKDVTAEDFKGLLLVIYPFKRTAETYEEWLGALDLATRWDLADIRSKAIEALSKLNSSNKKSSVEIILLAKKYRIREWLVDSYVKLVQRDDLSLKTLREQEPEDEALDWETTSRLFSAHLELIQMGPSHSNCRKCAEGKWFCIDCCHLPVTQNRIKAEVLSAFADELAAFPCPDVAALPSNQKTENLELPPPNHPTWPPSLADTGEGICFRPKSAKSKRATLQRSGWGNSSGMPDVTKPKRPSFRGWGMSFNDGISSNDDED
ncbi:hypothetical protein CPB83DRAFT_772926 [Crepidotus variabilis]|uniref:BTB domain-containing protein n=1 Tax=Crepidotus variabilis TaxID=179855 RepID=A0A9P6E953_9AGAR|nr:hypothetical protein CPB83DRAFT_772926 [Crepidotus variabilis]